MLDPLFSELKDGICLSNGRGELIYMNAAAERTLGVAFEEAAGTVVCGHLCAKLACAGIGSESVSACPLRGMRGRAATFQGRFGPRLTYRWGPGGLEHLDAYSDLRVHCQVLETALFDSWEPEKQLTIIEDIAAERELERMKEDWRSMIAHDLRSPLTNVFGTLHVLADSAARAHLSRDEDGLLATAIRSCERLLGLLNLYLDIAKLDAGLMRAREERVELSVLLRACADEQRVAAADKKATVSIDAPEGLKALADESLLFRVAQNLLSNALKFVGEGGRVGLSARRAGPFVELEVSDDGPGIAPEDLRFLFDRFFQADTRRKGRSRGTGLGLTFCREALRVMRGTVDVASELGKGTTFVVRLPPA